jgi:hypothetical protein
MDFTDYRYNFEEGVHHEKNVILNSFIVWIRLSFK